MNRPKQKGTANESAIVNWFKAKRWPHAKRITMKGASDEGDVVLGDGIPVTIEAKAVKAMDLSGWLRELEAEITNSGTETGVVIIKKRGTTDVGEYYALLPVWRWEELIAHKYGRRVIRRRRM